MASLVLIVLRFGFWGLSDLWFSVSLAAFGFGCGGFVVLQFVQVSELRGVGWYGCGGRLVCWRVGVCSWGDWCVVICLEVCFSYRVGII